MPPAQIPFGSVRTLCALALGATVLFHPALGAQPQGPGPISEEAYWDLLDRTVEMLYQFERGQTEVTADTLKAIVDQWEVIDVVALPNGSLIPIAHNAFLSLLSASPPEVGAARQLLERMQELRRRTVPARHGPDALVVLSGVLARPEFQGGSEEASALGEWLSSVRDQLLNLWYGLLEGLVGRLAGNIAFRWGLWAVGALLLGAIIAYALRRLQLGFVAEAETETVDAEGGAPLSAQQANRQAQNLAAMGDFRSAVRYLYMAGLIALEEQGVLRYDRARTNREYLQSVSHRPEISSVLREVVDIFDRVWYGFQAVDRPTFARFAQRIDMLRRSRK